MRIVLITIVYAGCLFGLAIACAVAGIVIGIAKVVLQ